MWMIRCSTVEDCHDHAALNDEGDWVILLLVIASVAASFVCIAVELPVLKSPRHSLALGIFVTGLTVALSWTFTHTVFTLHYANVYYRPDDDGPGGLAFPGHREPDYRDFLYYSFVIGCASQTADVATVSRSMRHLTMVHGIVSFAFNTAVLALTINVGASLLSLTMPRNRLVDLIAAGVLRGALPRHRRARRVGRGDQRRHLVRRSRQAVLHAARPACSARSGRRSTC